MFFEGSNGEEDWENNIDFPSVPYSNIPCRWHCHRGFARVFRDVLPHIIDKLLDPRFTDITVCGYSHGGALAVLCHEYIRYARRNGEVRLRSFAFGAPRVIFAPFGLCDEAAENFSDLKIIKNIDDIVTSLPPRWLGYIHPCAPLCIGEKGKYSRIDAHRPESYLDELGRLAKCERGALR